MNAADVIAYVQGGAVFCDGCEPDGTDREPTDPIFADSEADAIGCTCDTCGACYIDGEGWVPHETAVSDAVVWYICPRCDHHHPIWGEPISTPSCSNCLHPEMEVARD